MASYIIRRFLLMIPTLIGITAVVFFVMAFSPGGVSTMLMDAERGMRPQEREAMRKYYNERYGLDKPKVVQFGRWLNQVSPLGFNLKEGGDINFASPALKWPNLGTSFTRNRPVVEMIRDALPVTLLLNLITIPIIYSIAITTGIYAGRYRGRMFDVTTSLTFLALWSIPTMWAGVMLLGFFANKDHWYWFPTGGLHATLSEQMAFLPRWGEGGFERGWLLDALWHLVLPVVCLTYGGFAFLSKLMRSSVLENMGSDFIRTARAKGVDERTVLFRHVLRNSILPLITVAVGILPGLLGGSIIIESIFSLPGMGKLTIDAINARDREVVLATTLVIGGISTLSLLLADVCYAIADPRVSYE